MFFISIEEQRAACGLSPYMEAVTMRWMAVKEGAVTHSILEWAEDCPLYMDAVSFYRGDLYKSKK